MAALPLRVRAAMVSPLRPLEVWLDEVIRTTVGLRPYRAGGFVLRAEAHDGKTIVHDYGHGGGGMSLSWDTALMCTFDGARASGRRIRGHDLRARRAARDDIEHVRRAMVTERGV